MSGLDDEVVRTVREVLHEANSISFDRLRKEVRSRMSGEVGREMTRSKTFANRQLDNALRKLEREGLATFYLGAWRRAIKG